ncbi:MarR family transcriptional regulator [Mycobacterium frederiksbergense]|jgi:DNA-binding MarR family transcriptional regulator|uniref:MarR family winged helix-turn-helix transcriptional regulator n=1 Tax=Mycolicibacterium frederiksbergense TaxID=117567 RepID=UPI001A2FD71F|nr:MarR family transcriptional regulator [Mycolicibacterium frederiksbergense]MBJ7464997.1 MarR family transcriptional regulator [Mycolicibacterium sp.]MBX9921437.1 MarR family transcriptional regulator [Mycolicibacterium frederiksbergense]MCV7044250.1 MarR family transcriptional regulator [Mycolicibacterium frederiksbergense]MDO0974650.1 MarR family transcriptional regulator [Mycolicibacterium frederiksbergense]
MDDLVEALALLRRAAVVAAGIDGALAGTDLTVDRWRALHVVHQNPGCSMSDIVDALAVPSTSATRIVDALVELGAVYRTVSQQDRRRTTLRASSHGAELLRTAESAITPMVFLKDSDPTPI